MAIKRRKMRKPKRMSVRKGASKRRRLVQGAVGAPRSVGRSLVLGAAGAAGRLVYDSVSSLARNKLLQAKRGIRAPKAKRKLNFGSSAEGVSLKLGKTYKINVGGKGQVRNIPKVVRPLWTKAHFLAVAANPVQLQQVSGRITLDNVDAVDGDLPFHVYDLTFIGSMEHVGFDQFGYTYKNNGTWAQITSDPAITSGPVINTIENGMAGVNDIGRCTTWLHNYVKIRLLLYGRQKQSTTYRVFFFRCPASETTPGFMAAEGRKSELNQNVYHPMLMKYTVNPVNVIPDVLSMTKQNNKKIQILRSFTFNMKEQLSTEDVLQKTNINFNVNMNKIKHHTPDEGYPVVQDINNVAELTLTDYSTTRNAWRVCHAQQRVYMGIMATNYETAGQENYAPPSYDVAFDNVAMASELSRRF